MLNVRSVQAYLHGDRIESTEHGVSTGLRMILGIVRKRNVRIFIFVQVQSSLQAVFQHQYLQRILSYKKYIAFFVLNFFSEE